MKTNSSLRPTAPVAMVGAAAMLCLSLLAQPASAWERYNDAGLGGGCSDCHGAFTGNTSPKGTVFPNGDKHFMHRDSSAMNTACNLCHTSGDQRNPFIGSSDGTTANPVGLGCTGCHEPFGLRAHHARNGVTECAGCHDKDGTPPLESVKPPYYGTVDTRANNPANPIKAAKTNENWSIGDFLGLDNDGNNLYDMADFACGPYRMLSTVREGNNTRVSWQTAGGRTDAIQVAANPGGPFVTISPAIPIPGIGVVDTNYVDVGGATNSRRFYRVKFSP